MKKREESLKKQDAYFKRKYLQNFKKIQFIAEDPKYERSPFKPGFYFYESLLKNKNYPISNLNVNIPHTFYVLDSNSH